MSKGNIVVQISSNNAALPVNNCKVIVRKNSDKSKVFEEVLNADDSGKTDKIQVEAPEVELSEKPISNGIPYGVYDIEVDADGYITSIVEGVQVFSGITSLQRVDMVKSDIKSGISTFALSNPNVTKIETHQLVKPTPRNEQVGMTSSFYVLSKPYVPQYIVVHLGTPKSSAEDITTTFPEYIKNVASSEIYPTWPENAIRSNIYAQISYALNRVYTEWYRGQGYGFQITNSTAYDQCYIKGRNIFENISNIVDDIFNKYIGRFDYIEPMFAQYCNGTTVTCNGLSQWGTVDLANKNYDPLRILKYYYGNNIEIRTAESIEGIPQSYAGAVLKKGSTGDGVKVIQHQLNRIGKNYPAITKIPIVNGVFDDTTEKSVKDFQKIFNLTPDGIVGKATWYKLSAIYVGVKSLAELDSEGETGMGTGGGSTGGETGGSGGSTGGNNYTGKYPGYLLKRGSKGEAVEELQYYLSSISKNYNLPTIGVDGIFGPATENAVVAFQKQFGLTIDGIVGPTTWNKIVEIYKKTISGNNYTGNYPGYLLKKGMSGDAVKELQYYLSSISSSYGIPSVTVDGVFGSSTENAVKSFQKQFGLTVDGIVGPATWNKLVELYRKNSQRNLSYINNIEVDEKKKSHKHKKHKKHHK